MNKKEITEKLQETKSQISREIDSYNNMLSTRFSPNQKKTKKIKEMVEKLENINKLIDFLIAEYENDDI